MQASPHSPTEKTEEHYISGLARIKDVPVIAHFEQEGVLVLEDAKKFIIHWFYDDDPIAAF